MDNKQKLLDALKGVPILQKDKEEFVNIIIDGIKDKNKLLKAINSFPIPKKDRETIINIIIS